MDPKQGILPSYGQAKMA